MMGRRLAARNAPSSMRLPAGGGCWPGGMCGAGSGQRHGVRFPEDNRPCRREEKKRREPRRREGAKVAQREEWPGVSCRHGDGEGDV